MLQKNRSCTILVLAPHTDDAELGTGGAMSRIVEEGHRLAVVAFSSCRQSLPEGMASDLLAKEFFSAMTVLNLPAEQHFLFDFPVRRFSERRQEILEQLVFLRGELNPDMVLLPASTDQHQDHGIIHQEGMRAFGRASTVLGYELPWNMRSFENRYFIRLEERHLEKKMQLLSCYESQIALERSYFDRDFIFGLARMRGMQCGASLAEAFEPLTCII